MSAINCPLDHLLAAVRRVLTLWFALTLSACGGGGGSNPDVPESTLGPPDTANYYPLHAGDIVGYRNLGGMQDRMRVVGPVDGEAGVWKILVSSTGAAGNHIYYRLSTNSVVRLGSRETDPVMRAIGDFEVFKMPVRTGQIWVMYDKVLRGLADLDGDGRFDDLSTRAGRTGAKRWRERWSFWRLAHGFEVT